MLRLPVGTRRNSDLFGQNLIQLQNSLKDIDYIIIYEYSLIGQVMFGWIDNRCKQSTGLKDQLFGGKSIVLVDDPGQLPPVADEPLYHIRPSCSIAEQGNLAYQGCYAKCKSQSSGSRYRSNTV